MSKRLFCVQVRKRKLKTTLNFFDSKRFFFILSEISVTYSIAQIKTEQPPGL